MSRQCSWPISYYSRRGSLLRCDLCRVEAVRDSLCSVPRTDLGHSFYLMSGPWGRQTKTACRLTTLAQIILDLLDNTV